MDQLSDHFVESHLFYEQVAGRLFCGDLGTQRASRMTSSMWGAAAAGPLPVVLGFPCAGRDGSGCGAQPVPKEE